MALHVLCNCNYANVIPPDVLAGVRAALEGARLDLVETADLCRLAAQRDPVLQEWAGGDVVVLACHPRAVQWLFAAGGAPLDPEHTTVINLRTKPVEDALRRLEIEPALTLGASRSGGPEPEWQPWFPVIDYDRCTNCRQCFNFCLFGVYEMSPDDTVSVRKPGNCKNNCPACARICPQIAIMFPKLNEEPLNGGEIADEELARANVQVNLEKALGDNVYGVLQQRRRKAQARRLLRRREERERAEHEREACSGERGEEGAPNTAPGKEGDGCSGN